jgi:hypothetical protein
MQPIKSFMLHYLDKDDSRMLAKKFCKRGRKSAKRKHDLRSFGQPINISAAQPFGYVLWPPQPMGIRRVCEASIRLRQLSHNCVLRSFSFLMLMTHGHDPAISFLPLEVFMAQVSDVLHKSYILGAGRLELYWS